MPSKDIEDTDVVPPTHYVIAEITYGGDKSLYSKLEQLETYCKLLIAKRADQQTSNVLNVVFLAIIVNQEPKSTEIMNYLSQHSADYPNLFTLYQTGRFCYIQYLKTVVYTLDLLNRQLDELLARSNLFPAERKINESEKYASDIFDVVYNPLSYLSPVDWEEVQGCLQNWGCVEDVFGVEREDIEFISSKMKEVRATRLEASYEKLLKTKKNYHSLYL